MCSAADLLTVRYSWELPSLLIFCVDALGFLNFLALLIANGVVVQNYEGNHWDDLPSATATAMTYNSMPWIMCWYVYV